MKNQIHLSFLENGKEITSHPDEQHHEIVVFIGDSEVPVTICDLQLSAQCDDMVPDGNGGSKISESYHVTPEVMVRIGRTMGRALVMEQALQDLLALSYGAKREHLTMDNLIATMRHHIQTALK